MCLPDHDPNFYTCTHVYVFTITHYIRISGAFFALCFAIVVVLWEQSGTGTGFCFCFVRGDVFCLSLFGVLFFILFQGGYFEGLLVCAFL